MYYYDKYDKPEYKIGLGRDIKWCGRFKGGKRCGYCRHHAKWEDWSKNWVWIYLLSWYDMPWFERLHSSYPFKPYYHYFHKKWVNPHPGPKRYYTPGLKDNQFRSLMVRGCNPKKKCKCVSVVQRGTWYCSDCFELMKRYARFKNEELHDIIIKDRNELKEDILILTLAGLI